jgi:lysophospholipid acyltransferase
MPKVLTAYQQGASILTGFGFTGYGPSGESLWKGAANVNILSIELAPNFKVLLDSWNMKTNIWLRECVYKRVTPKGEKPGFRSSMTTFATSAVWVSPYSPSRSRRSHVVSH